MASSNNPLYGLKMNIREHLLNFGIRLKQIRLLHSNPYTYSLLWDTMTTENRAAIILDVMNSVLPPNLGVASVSRPLSHSGMTRALKWKFSFGACFAVDSKDDEVPIRMGL